MNPFPFLDATKIGNGIVGVVASIERRERVVEAGIFDCDELLVVGLIVWNTKEPRREIEAKWKRINK